MASSWRLAESLIKLRNQINAAYPNRNKASDGTIGDTAHAATVSDHNPNAAGVVAAFDVTHDPSNGINISKLADEIVASKDNRVKYLIRNREILIPANGWYWTAYTGADPHTSHLHISVQNDYDNSKQWNIKGDDTVKASDQEIEATVNYLHNAYFGKNAPADVAGSWKGLLKLDFIGGQQKIFQESDKNPSALKNNQSKDTEDTRKLQAIKDALK